jgi:hypothetical protein
MTMMAMTTVMTMVMMMEVVMRQRGQTERACTEDPHVRAMAVQQQSIGIRKKWITMQQISH